jgi:hypothetical protein
MSSNKPVIFDVPLKLKGQKIATETVKATYLVDSHGNYVMDNLRNRPYIVPLGYNIEDTINYFSNPVHSKQLLDYKTEGYRDLQRGVNGKMYGGFVDEFKPIASFDFGIACRASGLRITACEYGGGKLNLSNKQTNQNIDITGYLGNNPENVVNMESANDYYNKHYHELDYLPEVIRQKDPLLEINRNLYQERQHQKIHKPQKVMDLNSPEIQKQYNETLTKVLDNIPEAHDLCAIDQLKLINGIYEKQGKDIVYEPSQAMILEQTAQIFGISAEQHQRSMSITAADNQREKELGLGGRGLS